MLRFIPRARERRERKERMARRVAREATCPRHPIPNEPVVADDECIGARCWIMLLLPDKVLLEIERLEGLES